MPNKTLYHKLPTEIIDGWKVKRNLFSNQLSSLRPALKLYALFLDSDRSISQEERDNGKSIKIDGVDYSVFEIGQIENQTQEQPSDTRILKNTGGVGLKDCSITQSTSEQFNVSYRLNLTITNPELFDERPHLKSLLSLNNSFLLMYGWSGMSKIPALNHISEMPSIKNMGENAVIKTIGSSKKSKGFWIQERVVLQRYNFNFNTMGHLEGELNFIVGHNQLLQFVTVGIIGKSIKEQLNRAIDVSQPTISSRVYNLALETIGDVSEVDTKILLSPAAKTLTPNNPTQKGGKPGEAVDTETEEEEEVVPPSTLNTYIRLGYILELISKEVNLYAKKDENKDIAGSLRLIFRYLSVPDTSRDKIYQVLIGSIAEAQKANSTQVPPEFNPAQLITVENLSNPYAFWIPFDRVMSLFNSAQPSTSMIKIINNLITDAVTDVAPGVLVGTRTKENVQEIFVQSAQNDNVTINVAKIGRQTENEEHMQLIYRDKNSLIQSINMSAEADPNAKDTFGIDTILASDAGQDYIKSLRDMIIKNEYGEEGFEGVIAKEVRLLVGIGQAGEEVAITDDTFSAAQAQTTLHRYLSQNPARYSQIIRIILKGAGQTLKLLGYYLRRLDITFHGTCGIYAFNVIKVSGIIPKYNKGIYSVIEVSQSINNSEFKTTLGTYLQIPPEDDEEKEIKPIERLKSVDELAGTRNVSTPGVGVTFESGGDIGIRSGSIGVGGAVVAGFRTPAGFVISGKDTGGGDEEESEADMR